MFLVIEYNYVCHKPVNIAVIPRRCEKSTGCWLIFPHICGLKKLRLPQRHKEHKENLSNSSVFFVSLWEMYLTMFERLRKKWKVGGLQLTLILLTFAIGGSATGFVGKKIMNALDIGLDWLWAVIYILLVTLIWPLAVLIVSIPFGQFRFFLSYIKKIGEKMGVVKRSGQ